MSEASTPPLPPNLRCWVVTEGIAGTENQCLGVAEALGIKPSIKRIRLREPWNSLSPYLGFEQFWTFDPALDLPYPDILIASGRKSIAAARYLKKVSFGATFTVQIQDPRVPPEQFDLVALPAHDPTRGKNVIVTTASPNRITPERLAKAKEEFPEFAKIKSPRVAVLIGGNSKAYTLTADMMKKLAADLKALDAGLMITASRRTGDENRKILEDALLSRHPRGPAQPDLNGGDPEKDGGKAADIVDPVRANAAIAACQRDDGSAYFWDGNGPNPYFGLLAWADYILVTADSASMLSEAGTTGKPVYMVPMQGGSPRLDLLHENLQKAGVVQKFEGKLEKWDYTPLNDAQKVADFIREHLNRRRKQTI